MRFLIDTLGPGNVTYVKIGARDDAASVPFATLSVPIASSWQRLLSVGWECLLLRRKSLQEAFLYSPGLRVRLRDCVARLDPDVVIMDTVRVGQFFEDAFDTTPRRRWVLYMEDVLSRRYGALLDALSRKLPLADPLGAFAYAIPAACRPLVRFEAVQALLYRFERSLLQVREGQMAAAVPHICLVDGAEAPRIARHAPHARIWETPPCLPVPAIHRDPEACRRGLFVILGAFDYQPNAMAVRDFLVTAMPLIARELPDTRIKIVGKNAGAALRALVARWAPQCELTGYVGDLSVLLASATAMIIPVKVGSGPKLKTLEALAHGLPIITTRNGVEAIPVTPDVHCLVSDDLAEFPALMRRLQCPETNAALSARSRDVFEKHYSPAAADRRYAAAFLGREVG
jgi:hypothetical protein